MAEYTYSDIIMDPNDPRLEGAIGKDVYFNNNPSLCLAGANEKSTVSLGVLVEIHKDSITPFVVERNDTDLAYSCIIEKKEEPKPEYIPFQDGREFFNSYLSVESRLEKEDYLLSNHGIWLKFKDADNALFMVTEIWNYGVCVSGNMKTTEESEDCYLTINEATTWEQLLKRYTFLDGSPCGKLMEDNNG